MAIDLADAADEPTMKSYADSIFEPWERVLILSIALDDVPDSPEKDASRDILFACVAVLKNLQGRTGRKEAFRAVERANKSIRELCKAPPDFVRTFAEKRKMTIEQATKHLFAVAESRLSATDGYAARRKAKRSAR
jgi:hypothetical protein